MTDPIRVDDRGLLCPAGGFHVDPWQPAETAVVTHAHGDHARPGSGRYLAAAASVPLLERRLGAEAAIEGVPWGERRRLGEAEVSFHPAGHVLGSAQVRIETPDAGGGTTVTVVSGDYKRAADPTCAPFEPVPCDVFVTEATFGLPIYRWPDPDAEIAALRRWWRANAEDGRASLLFCYALGKAQRILAALAADGDETVYLHGAMDAMIEAYRAAGVAMLPTALVAEQADGFDYAGRLILAPPSARGTSWTRRFGRYASAFASGWMRVRGHRRRRAVDRGFVLSDHADWPALLRTIEQTGARRVLVTHGYTDALARHLRDRGLDAAPLDTLYEGESERE